MPRIRVVVIGDRRLLVEALGLGLASQHEVEVVGAHADVELALRQVREASVDVALVDNSSARLDIVRYAARLRDACPELRIIVLTSVAEQCALLAYVQSGVDGHLTSDHSLRELVRSIQQVHEGQVLFAPDQLVGLLTRPPARAMPKPLAPRELEVLQVLGTGVSTDEAAEQLAMSVHTLRTHLKHAMRKLGARSKLEAVIIAFKTGLIELPG